MNLPAAARSIISKVRSRLGAGLAGGNGAVGAAGDVPVERRNQAFWSDFNVTQHRQFADAQASLDYLDWRNDQYPGYLERMPLAGRDGKVVLDFGCGPGNDLVGFAVHSRPSRLIGIDISPTSIAESRARLALHGATAELHVHDGGPIRLDDASVDVVHCSGVLMHTPDPLANLREFRRVIRPEGEARIMVYNRESIWLHLWVAYVCMLRTPEYAGLSLEASFKRSTDTADVPLNRCWSVEDFTALATQAGFRCESLGAAMSLHELSILPRRFEAMLSQVLPREHREFLRDLTFDDRGWPRRNGVVAGIDGCFLLTPV